MKRRQLQLLLGAGAALWALTAGLVSWSLTRGASDGGDARERVEVSPEEAATIRRIMRENLVNINKISDAAARGDSAALRRLAREAADAPGPVRTLPGLESRVPESWRPTGRIVHDELRALARDGAAPTASEVHASIARMTAACVSCHEQVRLVVR